MTRWIRLNVLDTTRLSSGGVPWSEWCPIDAESIESVVGQAGCRGFVYTSRVRTKSGDVLVVGQSVTEIEEALNGS